MKVTNEQVRERARKLAEDCGCRTWQAHRTVAIAHLELEREADAHAPQVG